MAGNAEGADPGSPCREIVFDKKTGSKICRDTGEVIQENVIGEGIDNISRVGEAAREQPVPLQADRHDMGVGASLAPSERGRRIKGLSRASAFAPKVRPSHGKVIEKRDRIMVALFTRLRDFSNAVGLPSSAHETAATLLRCIAGRLEKTPSSQEVNALVAYAVLKAMELHDLAIERSRILSYLGFEDNDSRIWNVMMNENVQFCVRRFNASLARRRKYDPLSRVDPFIVKLVHQLKLDMKVIEIARLFVLKSLESGKTLHGKRPESVAAASVYLAAKIYGYDHVNQATVAKALGLKESNVRKTYRYLISGVRMVVLI